MYYEVNVNGAKNICQAAEKLDIQKIIFSSSVAIYGFAPPNTDESGKVNYFNEYGRTKHLAEKIYIEWFEKDPENRTLVIIRPTVIFGPGNRGNVYNLINQIASKKFLMFGSGKNIKSMAFVDNVSAFFEYSLKFKTGLHIFNYVDKPDLNMNDFVKIIRKKLFGKNNVGLRLPTFVAYLIGFFADVISFLTRRKLTVSLIRIRKFLSQTSFETSIKKLDFKPPYSLKDALHLTLDTEFNSKK